MHPTFKRDSSTPRQWLDTVIDRILQQWLQSELRNQGAQRHASDLPVHPQARPQTQGFDTQVAANEFEFIGDGHQIPTIT